jgi:hypothetical protein
MPNPPFVLTTESEALFAAYCATRDYPCVRIDPSQNTRRPDFEVTTGGHAVLVEVKEFTANGDDREAARSFRERGEVSGTFDGMRIRRAIEDAAGQLRMARATPQPAVVVLYDNIVSEGTRPYLRNYVFNSTQVEWGMYGEHVAVFEVPPQGRPIDRGDKRGGNRQMTPDRRTYISAAVVLCEGQDGPYVLVFHNFFATTKLPRSAFSGADDCHFRNPTDPLMGPVGWVEF